MADAARWKGRPGQIVLCIGRKGEGKTTAVVELVADMIALGGRYMAIVHDPRGQYEGTPWATVDAFRKAETVGRVNTFRRSTPGELAELAREYGTPARPVILVIDELDRACRPYGYCDDKRSRDRPGEWEPGNLALIVNEGRHDGVDLVGTARRPAKLHSDLIELAELVIFFHCSGHKTLDWIEEECGAEVRETVATLEHHQRHEYWPQARTAKMS